ncbi:hypothetical protein Nepgr_029776 [Nepenthes gracilis]|uniref:Uncharacterized protein n=1 Tax=Nepenthes gracilis TaxID=150966 RepID=A0AAD3TD47_NEPGR|nr:hypothetical protein Nepgr_029776 [Nepenthes gracilis]
MEIYTMYRAQLSMKNVCVLFDAMHVVALHAYKINSNAELCAKLQEFGSVTQMQILHFYDLKTSPIKFASRYCRILCSTEPKITMKQRQSCTLFMFVERCYNFI